MPGRQLRDAGVGGGSSKEGAGTGWVLWPLEAQGGAGSELGRLGGERGLFSPHLFPGHSRPCSLAAAELPGRQEAAQQAPLRPGEPCEVAWLAAWPSPPAPSLGVAGFPSST